MLASFVSVVFVVRILRLRLGKVAVKRYERVKGERRTKDITHVKKADIRGYGPDV